AAFPTFLICEQARRHVTVALTGDGGDESFAGYERYIARELAGRVPRSVARLGSASLRLVPAARREPRSPLFRAARLLDVASRPRERTGKVGLRRAFAGELPPEVLRRGKSGFGVPLGRWFRHDLRELAHDTLASGRGWFRAGEVARLLDEHEASRVDHGHRLWCL